MTDPGDPRLADYFELTDPVRRRRREQAEGFFIAESRLVVQRLLGSGLNVRSVLVTDAGLSALARELEGLDAPVYVASRELARVVTGFDVHRGVLAAADRPAPPPVTDLLARSTTVLVLEDIADQVNMGALFRNGRALGADAVLLSPHCCDPLYRRSVRVSMGTVLEVPFAYLEPWPAVLTQLPSAGYVVVALTPDPGAMGLEELAVGRAGRRIALLVGAEGPGLSSEVRAGADCQARIPMRAGADSLNVATAAALALHALVAVS